ncbi:TetR/AcrR family transcriptional regulator [Lichenicoccus sp.]|uniref:TetR/AcrR family transcriptional regulator n=1 Tax=Lichenicoccus sp. TaxID=2781899 RepID=UPI003D09B663
MDELKRPPLRERNRQAARGLILDAAERLLREDASADFSMRALAAEADVGFATPFNHFGNKNAIMQALSARLIDSMAERFRQRPPAAGPKAETAIGRVLVMGGIATGLLLEQPEVSKAVVGSLGVANQAPGAIRPHSGALWSLALGDHAGLAAAVRPAAERVLAGLLAFQFRGCVSFWIAGELQDAELGPAFATGASVLLLGFADRPQRTRLLEQIARAPGASRPAT